MRLARDASELYRLMRQDILDCGYVRRSTAPGSPAQTPMVEALPNRCYTLAGVAHNVAGERPVDMKWATANTLHFFAATDYAHMLPRYNRHAAKFLDAGIWNGAYGTIAMPQVGQCLAHLDEHPDSRRAIVSMGRMHPMCINRPACWNHLQFLVHDDAVHLICAQRSLNLPGVMPYDCVVLTNLLYYAATWLKRQVGCLHWNVGSLHMPVDSVTQWPTEPKSLYLPFALLGEPEACFNWLLRPETAPSPWKEVLCADTST